MSLRNARKFLVRDLEKLTNRKAGSRRLINKITYLSTPTSALNCLEQARVNWERVGRKFNMRDRELYHSITTFMNLKKKIKFD